MARRFDLGTVSHSAAVFDTAKLSWMNRHYMKEAPPERIARAAAPYFERAGYLKDRSDAALRYLESLLPMAVGSVDRLDEIPERVAVIFDWEPARAAALVAAEPDGARIVEAFGRAIHGKGPLDRETFRAAAGQVKAETGRKGRELFHPLRVALTGADSGPELDLAVPAIDRGAGLPAGTGVRPVSSCADRAAGVGNHLAGAGAR